MRNELERLITEANLLQDARRSIDKAIADIEGPLHIAQECLYQRESRQGTFFACFNKKNSKSRKIESVILQNIYESKFYIYIYSYNVQIKTLKN